MRNFKKEDIVPALFSVLIVFLMVGAAELTHEKEIIFPEITALTVGFLMAPKQFWRTNALRTVILIAICAVGGICIVRFLPLALWLQVSVAFMLCQIIFIYSGTGFAPMISAMVLPVLMGSESIIYPFTAVLLTAAVLGLQSVIVKMGLREAYDFTPLPSPGPEKIKEMICRVICGAIVIFTALAFGWKFVVAPPLLVAFTEFAERNSGARKKPVRAIMTVFLCALGGAVCRLVLNMGFGLPLVITATAAAVIMIAVMYLTGMFMPPAGALSILPMIIPKNVVIYYPFQILLGVSLFMLIAILWRDIIEKKVSA